MSALPSLRGARLLLLVVACVAVLGVGLGVVVGSAGHDEPTRVSNVDSEAPAASSTSAAPSAIPGPAPVVDQGPAPVSSAIPAPAPVVTPVPAPAVASQHPTTTSGTRTTRSTGGSAPTPAQHASGPAPAPEGGGTVTRVDGPGPAYTNITPEQANQIQQQHPVPPGGSPNQFTG